MKDREGGFGEVVGLEAGNRSIRLKEVLQFKNALQVEVMKALGFACDHEDEEGNLEELQRWVKEGYAKRFGDLFEIYFKNDASAGVGSSVESMLALLKQQH